MAKAKVDLNGKTILVTGSPGFIGANLVLKCSIIGKVRFKMSTLRNS